MRTNLKILTLTFLALFALVIAACGGAEGEGQSDGAAGGVQDSEEDAGGAQDSEEDAGGAEDGEQDAGGAQDGDQGAAGAQGSGDDEVFGSFGENDLYVSAGAQVLSASADQFDEEITSMQAEMTMDVSMLDFDMHADADFAFQSPDQMYVSMQMEMPALAEIGLASDITMDVLVRDETMYMRMPFFGTDEWFYAPLDEISGEFPGLDDMGSAFDYRQFIESIEGVKFVGEEVLDGRDVLHYQVSTDIADVWEVFGESMQGSSTGVDPLAGMSGPVSVDLWVGKSDFLPYKMTIDANVTSTDPPGTMTMTAEMRVLGYNVDVDIPEAPDDAITMEEAFGGLFGGLLPTTNP